MNLVNTNEGKIYIFSDEHNQHYVSTMKIFLDNKILGVELKISESFVE